MKFARQYAIELHAFCANSGHAPKILGFKQLAGGWFAVAMDYIFPTIHPSKSPHLVTHCANWVDTLEKLVDSFHNEGFVHGDLREPNILCEGDQVMLIDFDWGGKVGEACYPSAQLCSELVDRRVSLGSEIMKADDIRVLGNTIKKLKEVAGLV